MVTTAIKRTALGDLRSDPEANRTLDAINEFTNNEDSLRDLKNYFFFCLPFADDVLKYLFSPSLGLKIQSHGLDLRNGTPLSLPRYDEIPRGILRASPLEVAKHFYLSHASIPLEHWPIASSMLLLTMSSCNTERDSHAT